MRAQIRSTHPWGYRPGEWADLLGQVYATRTSRQCYVVQFPDGSTDLWAVNDPDEPYEFRNAE